MAKTAVVPGVGPAKGLNASLGIVYRDHQPGNALVLAPDL